MVRKRGSKSKNESRKPRGVNRSEASITKWNDISDIPLDEEEQYHASRDKILLEGDQEYEDDIDEDEVFALKGIPASDSEEEDEDMQEEDEGEDMDVEDAPSTSKKSSSKKKSKKKAEESDQSESEEETWGKGKSAYYASNEAQLESDDEEALALEEQEAKRLQSKAREDMVDADFGLEDILEVETREDDVFQEPAPTLTTSLPQDPKLLIRHLERTDAISLALARDWTDTTQSLLKSKAKLEKLQAMDPFSPSLGMIHLHHQTLLTYATALAFYLHLRAQERYAQKPELLKSHPVMKRLATLKEALTTLEDFNFAGSDSEDQEDLDGDEDEGFGLEDEDFEDEDMADEDLMADARSLWDSRGSGDAEADAELIRMFKQAQKDAVEPPSAPPKKKRKAASESGGKSIPVFDLVEPEFVSSKSSSSRSAGDSVDMFGEATALQHADAADKTARKKSLRFHTSKIESTSAKRQGARNALLGGDDDIPYKERKREKEDRLAKDAKARLEKQGGMDLDDIEPEAREDGFEEDEDGYYDLIARKSKEKKEKKKAEYEAARAGRLDGMDENGVSGPRSLTRAIMANKGLTPHRSKSVRNPRVKKRQKFEKAKKKVASQKAVYKGGISETGGRYDGERSGITKVVKSVRLG
ncbi:something about silencing protein 10 [Paramarasmius palmivorus]|uniref:Something about silencing protein 10 n=1 Tax=Paramarasmius palmivorus TaxID=297713 RepID=A0AAW0DY17_9AGAR